MARTLGADPRIGTELAGYRIEALLGRGGMSVVYLAEDLALGRKVALKLMTPELAEDRGFRERFRRESRVAASLDHPNVIPIYEAGEAEGLLFIAMRYVDGTDLRSVISREGALSPARALAILSQVAAALDAAHARGLVHRDVKPSNVLIAATEPEHVYLADFGLTRAAGDADQGADGLRLSGTADYVAPEQITAGRSDPASDLYSLGCVLYECLTGRVPFAREGELAVFWAHVDEPPPMASEVHPELPRAIDPVLIRALGKQAGERYESGQALIEAARAALAGEGRPNRVRIAIGGTLVVLVAAAIGATFAIGGGERNSTLDLAEGALQRVDPKTSEVVATVRIGGKPVDIAAGAGALWAIDARGNSLVRIDPARNAVTIQGSGAGLLAAVETSPAFPAYVGIGADGSSGAVLASVSARDLSTVETNLVPNVPGRPGDPAPALVSAVSAVAATASAGWFADAAAGTVTRLSRQGPFPRMIFDTGGMPVDLASARSAVWVAQRDGSRGSLVQLGDRGDLKTRIPLPFAPSALAADTRDVWIADPEGRRLWRLDPRTRRLTPLPIGGRPVDVALDADSAWVVTGGDGMLARVDRGMLRLVGKTEIGANPIGVAVGAGAVWVAVAGGRPLTAADFPRRLTRERYKIEGVHPGNPGARCSEGHTPSDCFIVGFAHVHADDATSGSLRGAFREKTRRGGRVRCLGKTYDGPITSDVRGDVGTARLDVDGWGTIALTLERHVLVVPSETHTPALCLDQSGTWVGIKGPIRGEGGTFTTRGPGRVLVFRS